MRSWTRLEDLRARVRRWWDAGDLLRAALPGGAWEPRRVKLRGPTSAEMASRFPEVRRWIEEVGAGRAHRLETRVVRHRTLGANRVPEAAWFDDPAAATRWIQKSGEVDRFMACHASTPADRPGLQALLRDRPLDVLTHADAWEGLLRVCTWVAERPRPGCFLRQVDAEGVDTKFIEGHREILTRMLDASLPTAAVDAAATGVRGFARRYGFRDKPLRVRLRSADPDHPEAVAGVRGEVTLTAEAFATLNPRHERVVVTENEINFLAFPPLRGGLVVFGAGYDFTPLHDAGWLRARPLAYWGDLDTHGFAMLDQFRCSFEHADSILMDEATLLEHRGFWEREAKPSRGPWRRLHPPERQLCEDLHRGRWGESIRLEQERIGYAWARRAVAAWSGV